MTSYDRYRVVFADTYGNARSKFVPAAAVEGAVNFSVTIFGVGYDRALIAAPGADVLDGMGDMRAAFDPAAALASWDGPHTGVVIGTLQRAGEPLAISPRVALERAVAALGDLGYVAQVGVELEAFVLQPDGHGSWVPWDTPSSHCYGTGASVDPIGLIDEVMEEASLSGLQLETVASEYDTPQFEFTIRYRDALSAIDEAFLLRLLVRETALRRGLRATFMGRPFGDRGGSGLHVNVSLASPDGSNLFADPDGTDGLAPLARHGIAGMLAHHEALSAICAPTVNAYKRLQPGQLSGYWANWGHDHRSVAVRVPVERGSATRVESRLPDGAANPYLATAALLQALRLGIVGELDPPAPETGDGLEAAITTQRCVPENLSLALDALEADPAFVDAMGTEVVAHFLALKREEWRRFARAVTDWELREYQPYH